MDKILVLGAGKSSGVLIAFLANNANTHQYTLKVADASIQNLNERVARFSDVEQFCGNLGDEACLNALISDATMVVSMLPPTMHMRVAAICLSQAKHLLTASYVSQEISKLDPEVKKKGLTFLMECGLDPGLDHMSAMQLLDNLKADGAKIVSFESHCGGLVSPESNTNPWGYKITWNPRNVVLAGKGTAQYLEDRQIKFVPYHQLFGNTRPLFFKEYGNYEAYPNRDSLPYIAKYGLEGVQSFLRGTIRNEGFCKAWGLLVKLGFTDDTVHYKNARSVTIKNLVESFCPKGVPWDSYLDIRKESKEYEMLEWLGCNSKAYLDVPDDASPADCLQKIIEDKWVLENGDKDLVLMQHIVKYEQKGIAKTAISSLSVEGETAIETAMAKTVGLPLGIAALLLLGKKIQSKGVITPVIKEIYNPILKELQLRKIKFREYSQS